MIWMVLYVQKIGIQTTNNVWGGTSWNYTFGTIPWGKISPADANSTNKYIDLIKPIVFCVLKSVSIEIQLIFAIVKSVRKMSAKAPPPIQFQKKCYKHPGLLLPAPMFLSRSPNPDFICFWMNLKCLYFFRIFQLHFNHCLELLISEKRVLELHFWYGSMREDFARRCPGLQIDAMNSFNWMISN